MKGSNFAPNQINSSTLVGSLVLRYVETISEDEAVVAGKKELLPTVFLHLSFFYPLWRKQVKNSKGEK